MRLIVLECCLGIAALVFVFMMGAIAWHRAWRPELNWSGSAWCEYLWCAVPWIMATVAAAPAVRLIVSNH